ncbi:MAG: AAA family ATPase [Rhodobacteraceae bacterium]|nr:AAA family ATPase [Paracoccaceae bacterium]
MQITKQQLTGDQATALEAIHGWAHDPQGPSEFFLSGYAGTGKTTLLKMLDLQDHTLYLAPTGKACQALKIRGVEAQTIHSLIYIPRASTDEAGVTTLEFQAKDESLVGTFLVVDEASMVSEDMATDLAKTGARILWVGDSGQLPPIGGDPSVLNGPNGVCLNQIVRQAFGSSIIEFSQAIRTSDNVRATIRQLRGTSDGTDVAILAKVPPKRIAEIARKYQMDQIICGFNIDRNAINRAERKFRRYVEPVCVGERLICTLNNFEMGVVNGEMFDVVELSEGAVKDCVTAVLTGGEAGDHRTVQLHIPTLCGESMHTWKRKTLSGRGVLFADYGYAVTCHKSQGSEWPSVLVVDSPCSLWEHSRWLYTAITRAKQKVIVLS